MTAGETRHPFDDIPAPGDWAARAACVGAANSNRWFPDPGHAPAGDVLAVCGACPVRLECLDYAVRWKIDHGVWGGLVPADRKHLRRHLVSIDAGQARLAQLLWVVFLAVFILVGLRLLGMAL